MLCFHMEFAIFCQGSRDPQGRPAKGTRFTLFFLRSCQHKNGLVQGPSLRDRLAFRKGGNSLHIHACVVSLAINIPEAALPPTAMKVEVWGPARRTASLFHSDFANGAPFERIGTSVLPQGTDFL